MSFLSIAFLAALPLAAAPILLHLFDRRRNVVIEWGAMQFLMEAASRRTSARKLKQWLLLLLRVLAVAGLVLAMSRPLLPGSWFRGNDRGETIFIIDNSMSMMRTAEDSSLFDQAIENSIGQLNELERGSFVRVLLSSPYPIWVTNGSVRVDTSSQHGLEEQLRKIRSTSGSSDLLSALFTAAQTELQPTQQARRIVVLTDGQSSDWTTGDRSGWDRFRRVLESAQVPTRLDVVRLDRESMTIRNVAVNQIHSDRTVVGVGREMSLSAQVQNYGSSDSPAARLVWMVDGEEVDEGRVPELQTGEMRDVVWKHSFPVPGVYAISCRIDAKDELAPDNIATRVVEVVDEVPVVLVESVPGMAEIQQDGYLVQAALGWIDGQPLDQRAVHVPAVVALDELQTLVTRRSGHLSLQGARAVVVPNFKSLEQATIDGLEKFVARGGGLWIALGPRTDVDDFNQRLFADGNGLAPLAINNIEDDASKESDGARGQEPLSIDPFVKSHPATRGLADHEQLDIDEVQVSTRFRFRPAPDDEEVSVLLNLTNGEPLVVEKYMGRGRVIVQAIPLRLQWSDLARSQSFVVIVQDWLDYLTQPLATRRNLTPGEPIVVHLADSHIESATLTTPHGDEIALSADTGEDGVVFQTSRTILPGDYSLEFGLSGNAIPFHVNRELRESDLTPLNSSQSEGLAKLAGLNEGPQRVMSASTNDQEPLWPLLLIALLVIIAGELALSSTISRERFGTEPIAATSERLVPQDTNVGRGGASHSIEANPADGLPVPDQSVRNNAEIGL